MKRYIYVLGLSVLILALGGCQREADIASRNVSVAADQFEVDRRVVFFNGITDKYLLLIEGRCSLGNNDQPGELTVTCKVAEGQYKKHFLGLSDNVSYFVEQMEAAQVDVYHYRVIFRPTTIIPDVDVETP